MNKKRGCHFWRNLGLFAFFAIIIGMLFLQFAGHPFYLSKGWAHPNSPAVCCSTPEENCWTFEEVFFVTADGLTLQGWTIPSQNRAAVILSHSISSNRIGMLAAADLLARHDYGVFLYYIGTHGASEGIVLPYG